MPSITVVIPCFNYGWIVAATLDSLIQQTYTDWEALIIDDGSTDDTKEVVTNYVKQDSRFRYIYQKNAGLSEARNTGLRLAQGAYIQFLDADDLLAPLKFEIQVAYLQSHPGIDLIYGDVRYFLHAKGTAVLSRSFDMTDQEWMPQIKDTAHSLLEALVRRNIMVVNAPLIRADLINRIGFFNPELRSYEDWEYWLRGALAGAKMYFDPRPETWALVRVHSASMTQNSQAMSKAILQVRYMLVDWLKEEGLPAIELLNNEGIKECYLGLAQKNMLAGDISIGIKSFWKLARMSGRYKYYLLSIPFWFIERLKK